MPMKRTLGPPSRAVKILPGFSTPPKNLERINPRRIQLTNLKIEEENPNN